MVYLQELVKYGQQTKTITLDSRLPDFIEAPVTLHVHYKAEVQEDFYLIHFQTNGILNLRCQRCMENYSYSYTNETIIAICRTEERAEKLLEHYECIVSTDFQVNVEDLLIDELHLYIPQFHPEITECNSEINQYLTEKNDSY